MDFNKPDKLFLTGNVPENFKQFKEEIENYFIATETLKKPNCVQVARLKNLMGKEALQLYNSLVTDATDETVKSIMDVLGNYCLPKKNEIMDVFKFISCRQSEGESFDKFLANLRHHVKICDFKDQESKLMKAQIALGIYSKETKERLLRDDASLEKIIEYCKSIELAENNLKIINKGSDQIPCCSTDQIKPTSSNIAVSKIQCKKCGKNHNYNQTCPALGKVCTFCKKPNHFSNVCFRKRFLAGRQNKDQHIQPLYNINEQQQQAEEIIKKVLERARSLNIKFNVNKFQYCLPEIKYLGVIFSKDGMRPDPEKVEVIKALKNPTNKKELQSLLGMVNFLRSFIPNLSQITSPLQELLKKNVHWHWTDVHSKAFDNIKQVVSSDQIIAPFDITAPITIQCDASQDALGFCLLQSNKPVYMASRSLNSAEVGYAQVEKELLAVYFSCSKLHNYVYGHENITIQTDHMPLVSLMQKPINKIQNNRLKRLRLKLLPYNFKIQYLAGKYMYIADFLSRCGVKTKEPLDQTMLDMVHCVTEIGIVNFSDERLEEFKKETASDEILGQVMKYYVNGWPTSTPYGGDLAHYFKIRSDIELNDGLLYFKNRIIIPTKLRSLIINRLHETHLGESKMNAIVSNFYYWPGVRAVVKNIVDRCDICQKYRRSNVKDPLTCHEIPNVPFLKVAADIAECAGKIYLIVVDYYSRWLEVVKINSKNSFSVKNALVQIFGRFGIPQIMIADNMPFDSYELREFAKEWNFKIQTTSPNYPQANGLAEKAVGIAKKLIKTSLESRSDLNLSLLNYRNSVVTGLNYSPAQLLMGRVLRSKLPLPNNRLEPKIIPHQDVADQMKIKRINQKSSYDRTTKQETVFKENDPVYVQDIRTKQWEPAVIIRAAETPRSYIVQTKKGKQFRRNSIFIRRRKVDSVKGEDV